MSRLRPIRRTASAWLEYAQLPRQARSIYHDDHHGILKNDPGAERAVDAGIAWLRRAQDCSPNHDGGVARHYSVTTGWGASYPETSGYIIPTLLDAGLSGRSRDAIIRALRIADWLKSIQFPDGAFPGGTIGQTRVPVTFNTGQILIGFAAAASCAAYFRESMKKAADWLVETQDPDGCWRDHPTPLAMGGEKTYETHVALGLFEAAKIEPNRGYKEAGLRQVDWALGNQRANGWLDQCCLDDSTRPLTHTLGYALRGIVAAYEASGNPRYLDAATRTADAIMMSSRPDGGLAGRFDSAWRPMVTWVCLTGLSQFAECWLRLFRITGRADYRDAGRRANSYVRRTMIIDGPPDLSGGVKGSQPIDGEYGRWQYLNWACKFTIDANRLELDLG